MATDMSHLCSLCGALPGEPCISNRGRVRAYPHKVRRTEHRSITALREQVEGLVLAGLAYVKAFHAYDVDGENPEAAQAHMEAEKHFLDEINRAIPGGLTQGEPGRGHQAPLPGGIEVSS